jgi:DNA-binding MarR family transcriptional regulator
VKRKDKERQAGTKSNAAFLLSQVGAHSAEVFASLLTPLQLSPAHSGILWMLGRSAGLSQRQLAATLKIHPSRLVAILDDLEGRDLVERQAHADDRRLYALHLTVKGKATLEKIRRIADEHRKLICATLSEKECEQLAVLLKRIADERGLTPGVHPGYRWLGRKIRTRD